MDRFQSSPVPKDGCNGTCLPLYAHSKVFQSSPVPKDGCNRANASCSSTFIAVSILTRPEGRVQPRRPRSRSSTLRFQSSPVPKDGCNEPDGVPVPKSIESFNPHPSRRTGATDLLHMRPPALIVSILTRPEGRVQQEVYSMAQFIV